MILTPISNPQHFPIPNHSPINSKVLPLAVGACRGFHYLSTYMNRCRAVIVAAVGTTLLSSRVLVYPCPVLPSTRAKLAKRERKISREARKTRDGKKAFWWRWRSLIERRESRKKGLPVRDLSVKGREGTGCSSVRCSMHSDTWVSGDRRVNDTLPTCECWRVTVFREIEMGLLRCFVLLY